MYLQSTVITFAGAAVLLPLVAADWQYRTRPDLSPPILNITIPASANTSEGYLFLAPFAGLTDTPTAQYGPRQAGPYIFRDDGELVWSGYGYYSIWTTNFQAGKWDGQDVLVAFEGDHNAGYGHGHGHATILSNNYNTIRELRAGHHKLMDKHEFYFVSPTTAVIQIYQPTPYNLSPWGGSSSQQWIVNAIFQELDVASGEVLFEWSSLDHVTPDEAIIPLNPGQAGSGFNSSTAWDYFHINSVDKDSEGNYLISARDACSVHKINGSTGDIIWRLDGTNSSFTYVGENRKHAKFCFQHHARFHPELLSAAEKESGDIEIISLYDNAAHGTENGGGSELHTAPTSSGKVFRLNTRDWTAELLNAYYPPAQQPHLRSKSQGSTQLLPNGNVLVNWGSEGAVTEYDRQGHVLFHAFMDSGALGVAVENYRGYKFDWHGFPKEDPAIVALLGRKGETTVYVSWNGDTETKVWRFSGLDERGHKAVVGQSKRTGFETSFRVPKHKKATRFVAEAVDSEGTILRTTEVARVEEEILPAGTQNQFGPETQEVLEL